VQECRNSPIIERFIDPALPPTPIFFFGWLHGSGAEREEGIT
jgi:hypothetical protein